MSEATEKSIRLSKVAREFNLGLHTVVEFLEKKGHKVESNPNTKIGGDLYELLLTQFGTDKEIKAQSQQVVQQRQERETIALTSAPPKAEPKPKEEPEMIIHNMPPAEPERPAAAAQPEVIKARAEKVAGPKTMGRIDLDAPKRPRPDESGKTTTKKAAQAEPEVAAPAPEPASAPP
ncbi:MAG TPA: hypothetical protein VKG92_00120, partial [Flavobacteriales bacterium]|nr:hypothetical protein [Flavobacteriales bacterium]